MDYVDIVLEAIAPSSPVELEISQIIEMVDDWAIENSLTLDMQFVREAIQLLLFC